MKEQYLKELDELPIDEFINALVEMQRLEDEVEYLRLADCETCLSKTISLG